MTDECRGKAFILSTCASVLMFVTVRHLEVITPIKISGRILIMLEFGVPGESSGDFMGDFGSNAGQGIAPAT